MDASVLPAWIQKLKLPAGIILGLVLIYALVGFWLIPYLLKTKAPEIIEQELHRKASIQEVTFNPFLFKLDLQGFELQRKKGGAFVAFDEFFIDFELVSVFRQALTFDQIRLAGLFVEIDKLKNGRLNFDDLLSGQDKKAPEKEEKESSAFPVWITQIDLSGAKVVFADQSRKRPFRTEINPINLSISNFQTYLDSDSPYQVQANFENNAVLNWTGNLNLAPLRSKGRIQLSGFETTMLWRYLQDSVNFKLSDGALNFDANYSLYPKKDALQLKVAEGRFVLKDLKITEKERTDPLIDIPALALDGIQLDLVKQKISIASLNSDKAHIHCWVQANKELNFRDLFAPIAEDKEPAKAKSSQSKTAQSKSKKPKRASPKTNDEPGWLITVERISVDDYDFLFEDRSLPTAAKLDFEPLDITLEHFSSDLKGALPFTINSSINQDGHIKVAGDLGLSPFSTRVNLDLNLNLPDFQAYLEPETELELKNGRVAVKGEVNFNLDEKSKPQLHFAGQASVDQLATLDKANNEKLLDWNTLEFKQVDFNLNPMEVLIQEIVTDQAYLRLVVNPDRSTNLSQVFGGNSTPEPDQSATKPKAAKPAKKSSDALVKIERITAQNASAYFADRSLKPKFASSMDHLNGSISGISSDQQSRAKIDLKGKADQTAPVRIAGEIQVFNPDAFTDITLGFKNLSLSSLSPYSGKFAGYKIKKGKMAVDLNYRITQQKLVADNKVVIKQLTLGDEVDSPDAVSLPLSLAIALMKDSKGVINIDLPIQGSLDDPKFSISGLIGTVLVNLITKAVTSPFAALGSLIEGDEDLNDIGFAPDSAELSAQDQAKLTKIAEALTQRPALNIEIGGIANQVDAEQAFKNAVLADRKSALAKAGSGADKAKAQESGDAMLSEDEYHRHLLRRYYMQITGMKHLELNAPMITQELHAEAVIQSAERKVYTRMLSEDAALRELALARGRNIQNFLIGKGLDEERIFLLDVKLDAEEENSADSAERVPVNLSLTAG